ncbi:MAG: hypothetical protein NTZ78_09140 [Candidatus Aureabacteria bacterium]|nr:hypothetical protein [Candidatus Auribacterota bacterium]
MRRMVMWCAVIGMILGVALIAGCKKRYVPRVSEEIIDQGVPVQSETVVE